MPGRPSRIVRRPLHPSFRFLLPIALTAVAFTLPIAAHAQPLPVTRLAYSAKYICGTANPASPIPAGSFTSTVVELHNPHSVAVTCSVKVVEDYPLAQINIPQYAVTVAPNGTLYFDCSTLGGGIGVAPLRMGFVEIIAPRQVKVVAVHRDVAQGRNVSLTMGKKSCPAVVNAGIVRHSATAMFGEHISAEGDILRNDTIVSIANLSNAPVNATIKIVNEGGPVVTFPIPLLPNGFAKVTGADLPPATPFPFVGGVTVEYPDQGFGWYMEVEEILKEYAGGFSPSVSLSVVEVQPITLR